MLPNIRSFFGKISRKTPMSLKCKNEKNEVVTLKTNDSIPGAHVATKESAIFSQFDKSVPISIG